MNRIIKKLKCKNINRSFEFKTKIGIEIDSIELLPAITIHPESKTQAFKWLIFFIELSPAR